VAVVSVSSGSLATSTTYKGTSINLYSRGSRFEFLPGQVILTQVLREFPAYIDCVSTGPRSLPCKSSIIHYKSTILPPALYDPGAGRVLKQPTKNVISADTFLRCGWRKQPPDMKGPPLWSSDQSSWLHPEVRVRFPALPDFLRSSGSGKGSTQPREYN
jgi:hypothetical protein